MQTDQPQREQALDPSQSFIVQAPAGSGKTSLLTQRFLTLLAGVKAPEEIVAITFTRKAAQEMRTRIIAALQAAKDPAPADAHAKHTWTLAKAALAQDQKQAWQLLDNPNRLTLLTIDALCARLTQRMPILSRFGANPAISDNPKKLYQQAVWQLWESLDASSGYQAALSQLLLHLDNNLAAFERLLIQLLAKRDQWLPYILGAGAEDDLRQRLENSLAVMVQDHIENANEHVDPHTKGTLYQLAQYALNHLDELGPFSVFTEQAPDAVWQQKEAWLVAANLCLTKQGKWRSNIDKRMGFPAATSFTDKTQKQLAKDMKALWKTCLADLSDQDALREMLVDFQGLPSATFAETQWAILDALLTLLPILSAQLTLVFQQHNEVDFVAIALSALEALGDDENPTDLAMFLEHQMQHLLIDEFQDTSQTQYRLFESLVRAWQPDDGHTLFVVGDPMQSIYRFREADVSLFLRATHFGIGPVPLTPLQLTMNFRSQGQLIDWFNQTFETIFPEENNINQSAICFHPATAFHAALPELAVQCHHMPAEQEAAAIVDCVRYAQTIDPHASIALLVKSRSHLIDVLPALRAANIDFQAVELEPLHARPALQDLYALLRALLHLGDRLAWLSVLRAPWCGLNLQDLTLLVGHHADAILWQRLSDDAVLSTLSQDGQQRAQHVRTVFTTFFATQFRVPLRDSLFQTWQALQGDKLLDAETSLKDIDRFLQLVSEHEQGGELPDITVFDEKLLILFASSASASHVQVMTLHKSKGLEFDIVLLPALHKSARIDSKPLLYWQLRLDRHGHPHLLLAPLNAKSEDSDPLYNFLRYDDQKKAQHELNRLLYVAATRAKKRLHLFSAHDPERAPAKNSLLAKLWPVVETAFESTTPVTIDAPLELSRITGLQRLPLASLCAEKPINDKRYTDDQAQNKDFVFSLEYEPERHTGILFHRIIEHLIHHPVDDIQAFITQAQPQWQSTLSKANLPSVMVEQQLVALNKAIIDMHQDPKGQWILHTKGQTEWALTHHGKRYVIDRTFIDEGQRWIIDYKFSAPSDGESQETFLNTQHTQYQAQLNQYAKILREQEDLPIRIALYFPRLPCFSVLETVVPNIARIA